MQFFSRADFEAHQRLQAELAALREDIAPTWLSQPYSIEETAERYVRPALRAAFVRLCRGSVGEYLDRFGFQSDLVKAMYAVTDGFSGLYGGYDTPGTGMNFLIHNMCRLPGGDGTWMIVEGGMGTVARVLADALARHGGSIVVAEPVASVIVEGDTARGVVLEDGSEIRARAVLVNADPFRMQALVGAARLPAAYNARLAAMKRPGSTFKLNLALERAPSFRCLPQHGAAFGPTIHLLPEEASVLAELERGWRAVQAGKLADFPSIEWYMHSTVDSSLRDARGSHQLGLLRAVGAVRAGGELLGCGGRALRAATTRDRRPVRARHELTGAAIGRSCIRRRSSSTSASATDTSITSTTASASPIACRTARRSPGCTRRAPGTHPAGSVIGCAGYLAAGECLRDLGVSAG